MVLLMRMVRMVVMLMRMEVSRNAFFPMSQGGGVQDDEGGDDNTIRE
jgi:hypothetical protein